MGTMCDNFIIYEDNQNEFKMWQGLVGAHYTPYVDAEGNLSWTNNGGLPNPPTMNIRGEPGTGLEIKGIVPTVGDLPQSASSGDVYLVGESAPYEGYLYTNGEWGDIGEVGIGEPGRGIYNITKTGTVGLVDTYTITYTDSTTSTFTVTNGAQGEQGSPGAAAGFGTPTATIDANTGTPSVTVTASGADTAKVFAFAFHNLKGAKGDTGATGQGVPTGGTTGQVLAKASGANYDTEWVNQSAGADPATVAPLMDGTAAVGTSTKYARQDHVHPVYDQIVRQNLLDNWYFVGGGSQLGSGVFPINQRGQTAYSGAVYCADRWKGLGANCSFAVSSGYCTVGSTTGDYAFLAQNLTTSKDDLLGKTVTLTILLADGTLGTASGVVASSGAIARIDNCGNIASAYYDYPQNWIVLAINANSTENIVAIKFEIGDTQTLAHQVNGTWVLNDVPEYFEQLDKCRHWYLPNVGMGAVGTAYSNGTVNIIIPAVMKTPVAVESVNNYDNIVLADGSIHAITSIAANGIFSSGIMFGLTVPTLSTFGIAITANTSFNIIST